MAQKIEKKVIQTAENGPKAIGPYSLGIQAGPFIFVSGQIGLDPATGKLVDGGVENETRQVLQNIAAILKAGGVEMENIVKTTVFLRDINDFSKVNEIYATFFKSEPPARSVAQAVALPRNASIVIEAIAIAPGTH